MNNKPSTEDISKLHAEINQYINQRLIIATSAVTIFGVVMGWVVFGLSTTTQEGIKIQTQPVSLLLPIALIIVLIIMLWYCQTLIKEIIILSVYLEITESSHWEKQYQSFVSTYEFATPGDLPLVIFATLDILSITIPSAISFLFPPNLNFQMGLVVCAFIISAIASILVLVKFWRERHYSKFRLRVTQSWQPILLPESNQVRLR